MYYNEFVTSNKSFSGVDMVAMCQIPGLDGAQANYTLGSLQTLSYSIHMQRAPIRSIGNINAKDYVMGPRTIAGSLVFAVFNKHFAYEVMNSIKKEYNPRYTFLADELPPFNVTVSFANEYGAQARLVIYGIRLVNEGQVMSVNDIYTENTYQFVATDIEYLTDSNGYSTYTDPDAKKKVSDNSSKYDNSATGKDIAKKIKSKKAADSKDTKILLKVSSVSSAFNGKKGIVRVSVNPWQTSGTITIKGKSLSQNIDINVSEYKNEGIYVALDAGTYSAKFNDKVNRVYSDEKQFLVASLDVPAPLLQAAPIIEFCSDKKMSVYANSPKHNKLRFAEVDGTGNLNWIQVDLKARRVILQGLKEQTMYILYTFGDDSESMRIYAKTDEFFDRPYEDLEKFIMCNKSILQYGTCEDYIKIIEEAKNIAIADPDYISITTAMIKYRDIILSQLSSLKISDFSVYTEYEKKLRELSNILAMCYYLISIVNMMQNDNAVYMNTMATVKPPAPELVDAINCVFLFGDNIEKLEFYRQYNKVTQFAAEVLKIAFFNHNSGKKGFRFVGKPGYNYYVYAFNSAGERSPMVQFYVMTDDEKAAHLNSYYLEKDAVNTLLLETERAIGPEIDKLNVNQNNHRRLLIENAKAMEANVFPAPTVISKSTDKITIDVSNNESVGMFATGFYAAIADTEDALYKRATYKQLITTNTVEFSTRYGGIKPDRMYSIWIENSDGMQVSPSITAVIYASETSDTLNEEESIDLYRVENIINQVSRTLSNKINITTEIAAAINNLKDDDTITYKNVFDKLAFNILSLFACFLLSDQPGCFISVQLRHLTIHKYQAVIPPIDCFDRFPAILGNITG
jgi:hypothetical protein